MFLELHIFRSLLLNRWQKFLICRCRFRINGDRFLPETTSAEGANYRGLRPCFPRKCSGFAVTLLSPLSWVSESFWKLWPISIKRWKLVWIRAWFECKWLPVTSPPGSFSTNKHAVTCLTVYIEQLIYGMASILASLVCGCESPWWRSDQLPC